MLNTYTVEAIHPNGTKCYDIELIASTGRAAISIARGTMVHRDHDMDWLTGVFEITDIRNGVHRTAPAES
jgi:hypothetical protein